MWVVLCLSVNSTETGKDCSSFVCKDRVLVRHPQPGVGFTLTLSPFASVEGGENKVKTQR